MSGGKGGADERGPWPAPLGAPSMPALPTWADEDTPVFVISVAAQIAGMHAQTLRSYDRIGLVSPGRASGGGRRYSQRDITMLREVQRLSQEGVSLEGIKRILQLENQVAALQRRVAELSEELERRPRSLEPRIFAAGAAGDVVSLARGKRPRARSQAVVVWRPRNSE